MDEVSGGVRGYKVFKPDWTCRGKQYTCPGKFEENGALLICKHGMHFCKRAADCFTYYDFNPDFHVAEVVAYGRVVEQDDKCVTDKLEIVREVSWHEVLDLTNIGHNCTGFKNSGNGNSGNWNSGNRNIGHGNSGDWNKCSSSNGCFNTIPQPKVYMFNKPSNWDYADWLASRAAFILSMAPCSRTEWVALSNMTDVEKTEHPEAVTVGGFLREAEVSAAEINRWWRRLPSSSKEEVLSLPNFDKAIFKEITGIDIDAE